MKNNFEKELFLIDKYVDENIVKFNISKDNILINYRENNETLNKIAEAEFLSKTNKKDASLKIYNQITDSCALENYYFNFKHALVSLETDNDLGKTLLEKSIQQNPNFPHSRIVYARNFDIPNFHNFIININNREDKSKIINAFLERNLEKNFEDPIIIEYLKKYGTRDNYIIYYTKNDEYKNLFKLLIEALTEETGNFKYINLLKSALNKYNMEEYYFYDINLNLSEKFIKSLDDNKNIIYNEKETKEYFKKDNDIEAKKFIFINKHLSNFEPALLLNQGSIGYVENLTFIYKFDSFSGSVENADQIYSNLSCGSSSIIHQKNAPITEIIGANLINIW